MLVHHVVLKDLKAGLFGKDLCDHILQQMTDLKHDALVFLFHGHFHTNLIVEQITGSPIRRQAKGCGNIAATDAFLRHRSQSSLLRVVVSTSATGS